MGSLQKVRLDVEASEVAGIREKFEGITFILARQNNKKHQAKIREIARLRAKEYEGLSQGDPALDDLTNKVRIEALPDTVILGWENMTEVNEAGEEVEVPYSAEKCLEYLTDPQYQLWHEWIDVVTATARRFLVDAVKNSARS